MKQLTTILNESQARSITVTLRLLEERLVEIERLLTVNEHGILYSRVATFTPRRQEEMRQLIGELRAGIKTVTETFELKHEPQDPARRIVGLLAITWESIEEMYARRLRAHGEVDPDVQDALDPWVEKLTRLVLELEYKALEPERREAEEDEDSGQAFQ